MCLNIYFKDSLLQKYFQILYILTDIFNFYTLSKDLSGFKSTKLVDFQHCFVGFCICDYRNSRHLSQKMPKIYFDISNQRKRFSLMPKKILFPHQGFAREGKKFCSLSDLHFFGQKNAFSFSIQIEFNLHLW